MEKNKGKNRCKKGKLSIRFLKSETVCLSNAGGEKRIPTVQRKKRECFCEKKKTVFHPSLWGMEFLP